MNFCVRSLHDARAASFRSLHPCCAPVAQKIENGTCWTCFASNYNLACPLFRSAFSARALCPAGKPTLHLLRSKAMPSHDLFPSWGDRKVGKNRFLFAFSLLFTGCSLASLSPSAKNKQPDEFQEELEKAEFLEGQPTWKLKPDVVLRHIPIGTSIEQAKCYMETHGFTCTFGSTDEDDRKAMLPPEKGCPPDNLSYLNDSNRVRGTYLTCWVYKRVDWLTGYSTTVTFYFDNGKVTNVEAMRATYGP